MQNQAPVGVFDSGLGGLATLKGMMRALPGEDFLYYGDNANAPYGELSQCEIRRLTFACVDFLLDKGAKCIVIACNTASSAAVQAVREQYKVPIVAMEPAVRPAAAAMGEEGKALVLATPATLRQALYKRRIRECGIAHRVVAVPAPHLVELMESGVVDGPELDACILAYLTPYRQETIDALVLGCTHFVHIRENIVRVAKRFWPRAKVLDGNEGTAHQLQRILRRYQLENPRSYGGSTAYFTSGDPAFYLPLFERLMQR